MLKITENKTFDPIGRGVSYSDYLIVRDGEDLTLNPTQFNSIIILLSRSNSINSKIFYSMVKKSLENEGCKKGLLNIQKNYYDNFIEIFNELSTLCFEYNIRTPKGTFEKQIEFVEDTLKKYSKIKQSKKVK